MVDRLAAGLILEGSTRDTQIMVTATVQCLSVIKVGLSILPGATYVCGKMVRNQGCGGTMVLLKDKKTKGTAWVRPSEGSPQRTVFKVQPQGDIARDKSFSRWGIDWKNVGAKNLWTNKEWIQVEGHFYAGGYKPYVESLQSFQRPLTISYESRIAAGTPSECLGVQVFPSPTCMSHACGYVSGIGWWRNTLGIVTNVETHAHTPLKPRVEINDMFAWQTVTMELPTDGNNKYYLNGKLIRTYKDNQRSFGKLRFMGCATGQYRNLIVRAGKSKIGTSFGVARKFIRKVSSSEVCQNGEWMFNAKRIGSEWDFEDCFAKLKEQGGCSSEWFAVKKSNGGCYCVAENDACKKRKRFADLDGLYHFTNIGAAPQCLPN